MRRRHLAGAFALGTVATIVLAGCTGSDSGSGGGSGPVQLEFWAWSAESQAVVDQWNEANPDIQVTYTDAGGGDDSSTRLVTATRAGTAPDVALVEYLTLPAMVVGDVAADITPYIGDIQDAFTEGTWAQTTFGGAVYGIPQDVGPMALVYRSDLFEEMGIDVPETWEDFRAAAAQVREANPDAVIAALPPQEFGFWAGVATQAGGSWWEIDGEDWRVGIADEASLEVADFFESLAADGLISTEPLLTPEYNAALNSDRMLSWPSAVWAPSVIESVAADTAGGWSLAPLPQWTPGDAAVAYQGGSALVVTTSSDHPEEAARFAAWLNASTEGNDLLINTQALYPASIEGQEMTVGNEPPALMPQQTDFYEVAADIASDTLPVTWGPNVNVARAAFEDAMAAAITNGTPWRDALIATQEAVIDDLRSTGYNVAD
jgi:multiple sugar transport system substrate-binding protein